MTVGDLKKQFERLGVNDDTDLYLVKVAKCQKDVEYEPVRATEFRPNSIAIFFYGPDGKEVDYDKI